MKLDPTSDSAALPTAELSPYSDKCQALLDAYGASHRHPVNKLIHRIAVPIIAVDMLGLAHAVPIRVLFGPTVPSFASVTALLALLYYARLSMPLAAAMAVLAAAAVALASFAQTVLGAAFLPVLLAIFGLAWLAQFYGHVLEGKRPSFLRDLQFLLVGPLWLLADYGNRLRKSATRRTRLLNVSEIHIAPSAAKLTPDG